MNIVAQRLQEALEIRGLKQADLVRLTSISKSLINNYVRGNSVPKIDKLYKISKALNVKITWLLGDDTDMESLFIDLDNYIYENDKEDVWYMLETYLSEKYPYLTKLTKEEFALINNYRALTDKEKEMIEMLVKIAKMKQEDENSSQTQEE
ncbi:MAG: helix-turn-helix transcriptional regulator [Clostridia bacterium]